MKPSCPCEWSLHIALWIKPSFHTALWMKPSFHTALWMKLWQSHLLRPPHTCAGFVFTTPFWDHPTLLQVERSYFVLTGRRAHGTIPLWKKGDATIKQPVFVSPTSSWKIKLKVCFVNMFLSNLLQTMFKCFMETGRLIYFIWSSSSYIWMLHRDRARIVGLPGSLSWTCLEASQHKVTGLIKVTQPCACDILGDSGGVVNSHDFCPASLKSLGCFYFQCVLSSQWKAVTVNLRILHCQR